MTGKMILTAVTLLMAPTRSQIIQNREEWFQEAPFWSAMLCSMENSRALTIYVIYTDRSYRLIEFSSAFVSRVYENCENTILLKSHHVPGNEKTRTYPQRIPRNVLQEILQPDKKNYQSKVKLLGRASTTTVILLENEVSFNEILLQKDEMVQDWNSEGYFVILMISDRADDIEKLTTASEMVLRRLWKQHQILNAFFAAPHSAVGDRVFAYNPFLGEEEEDEVGSRRRRGKIEIFAMRSRNEAFEVASRLFSRDSMNLHGYILNVGMFEKAPTAIKLKKGGLKQYAENSSCECSKGYGGSDGIMLGTLAHTMNFTVNIVEPSNGVEFGYQMENGTYVGTLGDVVSGKIDVSFNGMFMKVYGKDTNVVEFSTPVGFDRICIVVPKARKKPQWLKIFKCFDLTVWLYLAITQIICGTIWYMLKKNSGQTRVDYRIVLLDTVLLFVNSPQRMPKKLAEKIFIGSFLLLSVIVIGTFQGSLYQSFTTDSYYKNIDTLKDLEHSGLPIGTTSPNLHNVFGIEDNESQTVTNLRKRIKILTHFGMSAVERAAYLRNMAAVRRETDLEITLRIQFVDKNGNMLLHAVQECPQAYFLSYIGPKKSIFLRRINVLITRAMEGGLPRFWLTSTIDNLISVHRVAEHRGPRAPKKLVVFTLDDVQTSFYILILGYLLSVFVFLWESARILVCGTRVRTKRDKRPLGSRRGHGNGTNDASGNGNLLRFRSFA